MWCRVVKEQRLTSNVRLHTLQPAQIKLNKGFLFCRPLLPVAKHSRLLTIVFFLWAFKITSRPCSSHSSSEVGINRPNNLKFIRVSAKIQCMWHPPAYFMQNNVDLANFWFDLINPYLSFPACIWRMFRQPSLISSAQPTKWTPILSIDQLAPRTWWILPKWAGIWLKTNILLTLYIMVMLPVDSSCLSPLNQRFRSVCVSWEFISIWVFCDLTAPVCISAQTFLVLG